MDKKEEFEKKLNRVLDKIPFGEILLVLIIAGFISLIKYSYDSINMSILYYRWQQAYFLISRGYYLTMFSGGQLYTGMEQDAVFKSISQNLPVERICRYSNKEGCWPKKSHFADGSPVTWDNNGQGVVLTTGTLISHIQPTSLGCNNREVCSAVSIDINGLNGPNKFGNDQFRIYYYKDKISPYHPYEDKLVGDTIKKFLNIK